MIASLTDLISSDEDRVMIVNLGPKKSRNEEMIEFLGVHNDEDERRFIIV
jgi:hypothetical protein